MKNLIVTALLIAGISSYAQQTPRMERQKQRSERMTIEKRSELRLERLSAELGLNATQRSEMSKLFAEKKAAQANFKANRKAVKEAQGNDSRKGELRKQMIAQNEVFGQKMKSILTADQYAKWESSKGNKKAKMKNHKKGHNKGKGKKFGLSKKMKK